VIGKQLATRRPETVTKLGLSEVIEAPPGRLVVRDR
jgi:hypothetical protein